MEAYNSTAIRDVLVNTTQDTLTSSWGVTLNIFFENTPNNKSVSGTIQIDLDTDVTKITELFDVTLNDWNENGEIVATANFTIPAVMPFTPK